MVTFWFTKVKLGLSELGDVPERYYDAVLQKLVEAGLYDGSGNPVTAQ